MKNLLKVVVVDDEPLARKGMLMRLAAFAELQVIRGGQRIFRAPEMEYGNIFRK